MWQSIQYVSSGLTLVAFIVAAAAAAYKSKSRERERLIQSAKDDQRAELVRNALEFFNVDTTGLSKDQKYELALAQIQARSKRYGQTTVVVCIVAVLMAVLAGSAIYLSGPTPKPGPTGTDVRGPGAPDRAVERFGVTLGWQLGRFEFVGDSPIPEAQQAAPEIRRQIQELLAQDKFPHSIDALNPRDIIQTVVSYYGTTNLEKHAFILLGIAGFRGSLVGASRDAAANDELKQLAASAVNAIDRSVVNDRESLARELLSLRPQNVDEILDVFEKWKAPAPNK